MTIKLLDVSHWQSPIDWRKAKAAGISGAYIKVSQGASFIDKAAAEHHDSAKAAGLLVGAYHFCTNDDANKQFANYAGAADRIGSWDLPPALDCEAYTSYGGNIYGLNEFKEFLLPPMSLEVVFCDEHEFHIGPAGARFTNAILGISYPSSAIIDSIGRKLLPYHNNLVAIYTNQSSGNKIFGNQTIFGKRYQLWVANWTSAAEPALPAAWKGKPWMNWQKGVVDGAEFGVTGKVDYNEWGASLPWPGNEEPPAPPPPAQKARVILKIDGKFRTFEEIDG